MWREFPRSLCEAGGFRGLVYSRPGYGRSSARPKDERLGPDFLHVQAMELLPALLRALNMDSAHDRPWLFGHSDGGSIALIYAAHFPHRVAGLVTLAPHLFVEELSLASISAARRAYLEADLRARLARHHDDVDCAFWGWNQIWLDPAFRDWNIVPLIREIRCPLLAVQGTDDEYGSMRQIDVIAETAPQTQLLKLEQCGHSPQRDQPARVTEAVVQLLRENT